MKSRGRGAEIRQGGVFNTQGFIPAVFISSKIERKQKQKRTRTSKNGRNLGWS